MSEASILFPNLGISLAHVGKSIDIFGFEIAYYGIVIALAMACGITLVMHTAKATAQDEDLYFNLAMVTVVAAVLGARIYYVAFSWEDYRDNLWEILNFRGGGLAIYGGVLAGALTVWLFARKKKLAFRRLADTVIAGVALGQLIGRWGNFFNREAFGGYTNGLLAMALPKAAVRQGEITAQMLAHPLVVDGVEFVQVHPTFLYESLWNTALLLILLWRQKRKSYEGEVFLIYLAGYGIGRCWVESLRTDQLLIPGTGLPVSQVLSLLLAAGAVCTMALMSRKKKKGTGEK